jgi:hypothetical protein
MNRLSDGHTLGHNVPDMPRDVWERLWEASCVFAMQEGAFRTHEWEKIREMLAPQDQEEWNLEWELYDGDYWD